ncbi:MAG: bifunctional adenosylcobinamide kinase/adenosylcobinamide-phosphate guanylyltransferase, partial [Lachnospiraceae bacterium]|nr:bifunctional adenosylcobinamide kinase/adenosylcobinamide-phosphate guanylyltransferase [Lachnospiraceae bacterium]
MNYLVLGGSGSGKSAYAERLAVDLCRDGKLFYIATMLRDGRDAEKRIRRHRALREGKGFQTLEQAWDMGELAETVKGGTLLLEALSDLAANEFFRMPAGESEGDGNPEISDAGDREPEGSLSSDVLDGDMRDSGPTVIRNEAEGCEAEECGAEGCEAEECRAEGCEAEGYEAEGCRAEGCEAEGCGAEGYEAEGCRAEGCEAEECEAEGCEAEDALSGTPDGGEEEWTWLPTLSPRECADKILADLSV